jgi:predicted RNase H-like HicB family nuclease
MVFTNTLEHRCIFESLNITLQKSYEQRYDDNNIISYYVVKCPDIHNFVTDGDTEEQALYMAHDLVDLFKDEGVLDKDTNFALCITYLPEVCYI